MAKTLLKMVLGVLLLSGLFFFMLQLWEKSRSSQTAVAPTPQQEAALAIDSIAVKNAASGAVVEISSVPGSSFTVSPLDQGLQIDLPESDLALANRVMAAPHPLVASIEATDGEAGSRIKILFTAKAAFKSRQEGTSLIIDLTREGPEETAPAAPVAKKKVSPKKPKAAKVARVAPKKKSKPVPAKKTAAKATKKQRTEEDEFLAQLGIGDAGSVPAEPAPAVDAPPPVEQPVPVEDPLASGGDPFAGDPNAAQMAANSNKPIEKDFDAAQVAANLPPLTELQLVVEGGITVVRISKGGKTKHKIFPKRNPDRIVIDFQNVLNQLPPEIQGVSGSRVDRVRTSQFTGADGTISRIELFLNGPAQIDRTTARSSASTFELPIP